MDELVMHNPDVDEWFTARTFDGRYGLCVEIIPQGSERGFSYYVQPLLRREARGDFRLHTGMEKMVLNESNYAALQIWLEDQL